MLWTVFAASVTADCAAASQLSEDSARTSITFTIAMIISPFMTEKLFKISACCSEVCNRLYIRSVLHYPREFACLFDPVSNLFWSGDPSHKFFCLVYFRHFSGKVVCFSLGKLRYCINSCRLKKFRIFPADFFDAEKIGVVCPFQYQFFCYPCLLRKLGSAFFSRTAFQQLF